MRLATMPRLHRLGILLITCAGFASGIASPAVAQDVTTIGVNWGVPSLDLCRTSMVQFNTGYNHSGFFSFGPTTIAPGSLHYPVPDQGWRVVHDPFPFTHEPRPARVIKRDASWALPMINTEWIGSTDTAMEDYAFGPLDYFIFETTFESTAQGWALFNMQLRADDVVDLFLNPSSVYAVANTVNPASLGPAVYLGSRNAGPNGPPTSVAGLKWVKTGKNKLYARVKRTWGANPYPLGLNLTGFVFTPFNYSMLRTPACCLKGTVIGRKYHDYELNFSVLDSAGNPDPAMRGVPIRITRTTPALPAYSDTAVSDQRGDWCFLDLPAGKYAVSEPQFMPCVQTAPWLLPFYTVSVSGGSWSGVTAVTLTNLTNINDLTKTGFGNWCDDCAALYATGSDYPPALECECVPGVPNGTFNCSPVLKATFYNLTSWAVNRVRVEVVHPTSGVSVTPTLINIPAVPQYGWTVLPTIKVNVPSTEVGKAVCVRLSFINVLGGNETVVCVRDFCDYAPCATSNGGGT